MKQIKALTALIVILACMLAAGTAAAHPADGYTTKPLPNLYGTDRFGMPAEASYGQMMFLRDYPDPETLTPQEHYILAGTEDSPWGAGLQPWWKSVVSILRMYAMNTGDLPVEFTPEIYMAYLSPLAEVDDEWVNVRTSPLTNRFPRLDVDYHSPGDMFVKVLSEDEMAHYAQFDQTFAAAYEGHKQMHDPSLGCDIPVRFNGPVFFIRVYGWNGTLVEKVDYQLVAW